MKKEITIEWLKAACDDLLTIKEIIDKEYLTNIVAFHSQQAIEKSFKAILEDNEIEIPKVHSLIYLYEKVKAYIEVDDEEILEQLNSLYISSRYPADFGLLPYGKPTIEDAEKFFHFAIQVFKLTCKRLKIDENKIHSQGGCP